MYTSSHNSKKVLIWILCESLAHNSPPAFISLSHAQILSRELLGPGRSSLSLPWEIIPLSSSLSPVNCTKWFSCTLFFPLFSSIKLIQQIVLFFPDKQHHCLLCVCTLPDGRGKQLSAQGSVLALCAQGQAKRKRKNTCRWCASWHRRIQIQETDS